MDLPSMQIFLCNTEILTRRRRKVDLRNYSSREKRICKSTFQTIVPSFSRHCKKGIDYILVPVG